MCKNFIEVIFSLALGVDFLQELETFDVVLDSNDAGQLSKDDIESSVMVITLEFLQVCDLFLQGHSFEQELVDEIVAVLIDIEIEVEKYGLLDEILKLRWKKLCLTV
jgi:hypothetical protein